MSYGSTKTVTVAMIDDFRCRLACDGEMEFVLHHCIETTRFVRMLVVIDAALRKNIGNLLPDTPLAGADGAYPLQEFAEIIFAECRLALLQTIVIEDETFQHVFLEHLRRPDPALRGTLGIHTIADGDDGVEIVESLFPLDRPLSFCGTY